MFDLTFDSSKYEVKTLALGERSITYRAFMNIVYCANPKAEVQTLNIFVPECYYTGETINGYGLKTAPIFMPNTVGGYMEGPADEPGLEFRFGVPNSIFEGLSHGYVVVSAGIRGRNTGEASKEFFVGGKADAKKDDIPGFMKETNPDQKLVGRAPAIIVDMKAAIRYLRFNKELVPGNTDRIITSGTSAGGALSAMTGATGNHPDYEKYLKEIGAADASDEIFAASCYCPIHNLENADMAYEWLFNGENAFHMMRFEMTPEGPTMIPVDGELSEKQVRMSAELKAMFPAYVDSLGLTDENGCALTLDADGEGSFKEYVKSWIIASAEKELRTHWSAAQTKLVVPGSTVEEQAYLTIKDGKVTDLDWNGYVKAITRMKATPAFDSCELKSPECEEFGDEEVFARHFTAFAKENSEAEGAELADDAVIKLLNPIRYIRDEQADTAKYWRIRHGAYDRDTANAIPVILQTMLRDEGKNVDFALPWGLPHSGDYDLDELFAWIDRIDKEG